MARILRAAATVTALSTALAACGGYGNRAVSDISAPTATAATVTPSKTPSKTIVWGPCTDIQRPGGQPPAAPDRTQQCGRLKVPLDYAKPNGESIDMAVIRVKATGPGARIGSLVFNFGGPGASGVDTLAQAAKAFTNLNRRYDLVSFDPRGVGRSSGVRCDGNAMMDKFTSMNTLPTNDAERAQIRLTTKEFVTACGQTSGRLLPYVGTVNAAADMDRLREALGERQLNYFGISYGTQLGAVYATRFPKNVGRFVLDAPLDPSVSMADRTLVQTKGFQHAYNAFLKDCVKEPGQCEIGTDATIANKNVVKLMDDLKDEPLEVRDRTLTQGLAGTGIAAALYSEMTWPLLDQALGQAIKDDGRILLALADSYNGRLPDGSYTTLMSSFPAISCVDTAERPTPEQLAALEAETMRVSPLFGGTGMGLICSMWPVPGSDEARRVNATGSAPIMVIGGTGDPATPYEWAPKLTSELRTGVLVTYKGEGHGAYLSGDACIGKVTDAYLIDGKVPAKGITCPNS
ncbi:alpha/beta hydrolase [Streptosporangium sp. NBC_01810]|uniref:alpha/beta hydrolase n=1 Tax=Streptosporangium sp. NBC_01810 TaxID=2975951 RepID=UPI002DD8A745|nr:alpha/beta hydrolase [Streptosporangium sp. NBC_01810]WSA27203.1 alpha/beta hydrolase [Streptosporangium sp. NBC_01810]